MHKLQSYPKLYMYRYVKIKIKRKQILLSSKISNYLGNNDRLPGLNWSRNEDFKIYSYLTPLKYATRCVCSKTSGTLESCHVGGKVENKYPPRSRSRFVKREKKKVLYANRLYAIHNYSSTRINLKTQLHTYSTRVCIFFQRVWSRVVQKKNFERRYDDNTCRESVLFRNWLSPKLGRSTMSREKITRILGLDPKLSRRA